MIGLTLLVAPVLVAGGLWRGRFGRSSDPASRGLDAYARGDWQQASDLARDRLKAARDDLGAVRLLARALVRLGRDASAMSLYERLGPQLMTADDFYLLGVALSRSGSSQGGTEVWQQAIQRDPDHPEILNELTRVYLEADRFNDAARAAGRLAKHPDWRARGNDLLGKIELARDDPAGAVDFWRRAMGHDESGVPTAPRRRSPGTTWPAPCSARGGRPRRGPSSNRSW